MSDKIAVTIIITTYDPGDNSRYPLLYRTIQALVDKLVYPNLYWTITDDSLNVNEEMQSKVKEIIPGDRITFFNTTRKGVGYAKNNALKDAFAQSPFVFLLEDDWELKEPMDLLTHVQVMLDNPEVSMIRFGFLGGDIEASYKRYNDTTYWVLKPKSGFYVYSGQVSLRHYSFYSELGFHAEGLQAGQEEEDMCWRYGQLENPPLIAWPASYGSTLNSGLFNNIGMGSSVNAVSPQS